MLEKLKLLIFVCAMSVMISACGKSSDNGSNPVGGGSVTADGLCTDAFVNDYNLIKNKIELYSAAVSTEEKLARLREVNKSCDEFFSKHANMTCKAKDRSSGADITAHASDRQEVCDKAKRLLKKMEEPTPQ